MIVVAMGDDDGVKLGDVMPAKRCAKHRVLRAGVDEDGGGAAADEKRISWPTSSMTTSSP